MPMASGTYEGAPRALVRSTAEWVAACQARGETYAPLPDAWRGDMAFAYAVQDDALEHWTPRLGEIAGWKVGLTTPRMQALCGVAQPISGAILASRIHRSPAEVRASDFVRLGVESELSFRVARTPPASAELTAGTVRDFPDAAAASFELIDDRAADYADLDAASMVADNSWNRGLVLSTAVAMSELPSLTGIRGALYLNGAEIDSGMTEHVGGDPLAIVAWLANRVRDRGRQLEPGQWIMTGSMIPTRFPSPGETYRFVLEGFDPVEVSVR